MSYKVGLTSRATGRNDLLKRSNGEGSCRRLKNGTWEGRVCIGRGLDGKMERHSVYGKTKREVIDKMANVTSDVNNGTYIAPEDMTLEQWFSGTDGI